MGGSYDKLRDDGGDTYELLYESTYEPRLGDDGEPIIRESGRPELTSRITQITYRVAAAPGEPESEYVELPPWAQPNVDFMVTLGWFDEDDDGVMTLWKVGPLVEEVPS